MKTKLALLAMVGAICAAALPAFAQNITLVGTFDYPNAASTVPFGINDRGEICGYVLNADGSYDGFIRRQSGEFAPLLVDPHGSSTAAFDITNAGRVVGYYVAKDTHARGFVYAGGDFKTYNVPGAREDAIIGMNDAGSFVGWYVNQRTVHGYANIGGTFSEIQIPGSRYIYPDQVNSSNVAMGSYRMNATAYHGFYRDPDGTLHYPIDFPGARSTDLNGINNQNWMAGQYYDDSGASHGLLYQPPDTFIIYDYPGTTYTAFDAINNHGDIVGAYTDDSGNYHGLIAQLTQEN
jgi:hypothetical protein